MRYGSRMQNEHFGMRKWMVVDDTPAVLEAVAMLLESLGCAEVHRFNSAEEAIEVFFADPEGWDVVITDLDMPGMDGLEFRELLHVIRAEQRVLLATGSSDITPDQARAAGFSGMIRKPFPMRELIGQLEACGVSTTQQAEVNFAEVSPAWAAA